MSKWNDEYKRRLRRVAGETDDTVEVWTSEDTRTESDGYCETCYYEWEVTTITVITESGKTAEFEGDKYGDSCLVKLTRALDEVEDED